MSRYCQTVVSASIHQTLASSQGFDIRLWSDCYTGFNALSLASSYSFDVRILSDSCSLSCTKDLTSNQAFDVRILLDCWIVLSDSELFTGDTSKNYHLSGVYFLALIRKINLVTEFCAHWGRGLMGGRRGQAGKLNF